MAKNKTILRYFYFSHIIMLLAMVAVITLLSPREGKFKYEYQKGRPWMHQVLTAPFDFPVYKDQQDLNKEQDSILRNFSPYFNYNPKIVFTEKAKFRNYFDWYWKRFNNKYPKILKDEHYNIIQKKMLDLLEFVYTKGSIELPDDFNSINKQAASIVLVRDNIAEENDIDEVFTQRKAYAYISHELNIFSDLLSTQTGTNTDIFFKGFGIENYIAPNLFYDENTSNTVKESKVKNISLTEGLVQTGQRIILPGDMVTPATFKVLESLRKEYESRMGSSSHYVFLIAGQALLLIVITFVLLLFINKFRKEIYQDNKRTAFILFIITLFSVAGSLTIRYSPENLYFVPFAVVAIIIKIFYDAKLALLAHLVTIMIVGFWAPNSFEFVFLNLTTGIVAILSLSNVYRRGKMFVSSAWIIITYTTIYLSFVLYQEGSLININTQTIVLFAGNGLLVLASLPLVYIFEKMFGFVSDATLLEQTDTNQPLLRKLAEIAPGTFQHSLQVANLSEDAIRNIGGNPLLVRAGALYHDIGKMENPRFFIENISDGNNPHENLEFEESVAIITGHVTKGVEIAHKYKLPAPIVDFIRTHHGTSVVNYFYRSHLKKYPGTEVDISKFSYPGPKPFSREMSVVMMADSVEAASRSLKYYSDNDIHSLVEYIITTQLKEGQFNDSNITLKEIEQIKAVFKRRLRNIYHIRIEYPSES